jgi:hypothetical protein
MSQASQLSQGSQDAGDKAPCSVCGKFYKVNLAGGLNKHGYGRNQPGCQGSFLPPRRVVTTGGPSTDLPPSQDSNHSQTVPPAFTIVQPPRPVIPRIPKGARQRAASEFEHRLRAVIAASDDLALWGALFDFAATLAQPVRGGIKHNLTSQIIRQIEGKANQRQDLHKNPAVSLKAKAPRNPVSEEDHIIRRASGKMQEGDVRGAVRHLTSTERLAPLTEATIAALKTKHPAAPLDRRTPPPLPGRSMVVTDSDIRAAIRGFGPGSAGGRDGLRPQHLKDMTEAPGGSLCQSLAQFANLVLSGGVPRVIRPAFFGASLLPFAKKDGGIRPIAVGLTLRRLVAKTAALIASPACAPLLAPSQLGVGAKGGAEAVVHAARRFLDANVEGRAFVKLDFTNAFNSIRRDCVLEAVANSYPDLLPFVASAYGSPSTLWLGDNFISSEEGVQQGDPLGPLLFCLTVQPLLSQSGCEFVTGYLDDVGLGDTVPRLLERVPVLEAKALALGLTLNHSKCEILGLSPSDLSLWRSSGLNFSVTAREAASMLGSPLSPEGVDAALRAHAAQLREIGPRLIKLASHEAFFMLKSCFATPRLMFLLRSAPVFKSAYQSDMSRAVRDSLSSIININLEDEAWSQASLPVRWGGIGIRDVESLAPSAYLGCYHSTVSQTLAILPASLASWQDPLLQEAVLAWGGFGGSPSPQGEDVRRQRAWDDVTCNAKFQLLLSRADQQSQARLRAVSSPDAGVWLHTLPCRNLGLCLSDRELRVAVGLRLGAPLVRSHACVCGTSVDSLAHHGLSCRRSAGRQRRHAQANDVIARAVRATDVQAELEPQNLLSDSYRRPDGATLDPWHRGRFLVWDFTCPDTLAPSHVAQSAAAAGSAAAQAETNKLRKYAELEARRDIHFVPIVIETLGTWGAAATELCRDIGSRLAITTGDPRSHLFLKQRLSLAIQRGNASSIAGTYTWMDAKDTPT